jgi:hypothetical protein
MSRGSPTEIQKSEIRTYPHYRRTDMPWKSITFLQVNPVRNSSGALNPAGTIIEPNPAVEQRGIISNGVNK